MRIRVPVTFYCVPYFGHLLSCTTTVEKSSKKYVVLTVREVQELNSTLTGHYGLWRLGDLVTEPSDGMDQLFLFIRIYFFAQIPDVDIHYPRFYVRIRLP